MFEGPLFVVGAPRSGTKLLMRLLNNHPDIMLVDEFGSLGSILIKWAGADLKDRETFLEMYKYLSNTMYYIASSLDERFGIESDAFYDQLQDYTIQEAMAFFIKHSASVIENKPIDTRVWGQKSPYLTDEVDLLKFNYPEAKFIHIVRDVRNAALSSKTVWNTDLSRYSQRWLNRIRGADEAFRKMDPEDYRTIRYEDLTSNPSEMMKSCFDFLQVDYREKYILLEKPSEYYGDAKNRREVMRQDDEKYRKHLTREEIEKIESITFPLLDKYGYSYSYKGPQRKLGPAKMKFLQIKDIINRLIFDFREKGFSNIILIIKLKLAHLKKM